MKRSTELSIFNFALNGLYFSKEILFEV